MLTAKVMDSELEHSTTREIHLTAADKVELT